MQDDSSWGTTEDDFVDVRKVSRRRLFGRILLFLSVLGISAAFLTRAPYVIESPGPVINVLQKLNGKDIIQISNIKTYPADGSLDAVTVSQRGNPDALPSWGEVALAWLSPAKVVVPIEKVWNPNTSSDELNRISTKMMLDSQRDAIAVALRKQGYSFPTWLAVDSIEKSTPAAGLFKPDDVILEVDGVEPHSVQEVTAQLAAKSGKPVTFKVSRAGQTKTFDVKPYFDAELDRWRVGLFLSFRYDFPVEVKIDLGNVTGPSAGLSFTLGLIDLLEPGDLTGGYHVAATGTIGPDGTVGPIGGVRLKMLGAVGSGATFFFAPRSNCDEILGNIPEGLQVVTVETVDDALAALSELRASETGQTSTPLGCSKK